MYSGMYIFSKHVGVITGAHQKIDRVAREDLKRLLINDDVFPKTKDILKFEGVNGPDSIKIKSPGKDEPWHFIDPFDNKDNRLYAILEGHYDELVKALKNKDQVRSAFDAAWLAHALVDGLTPAHHHPYEEEMRRLRGGENQGSRTSIKNKLIMPGKSVKEMLSNNWRMWGPKGLISTHIMFEGGFATLIAPMNFKKLRVTKQDIANLRTVGLKEWFDEQVMAVADLGIYENFYRYGWTIKLGRQSRQVLAPRIIKDVTLIWYSAVLDAGFLRKIN